MPMTVGLMKCHSSSAGLTVGMLDETFLCFVLFILVIDLRFLPIHGLFLLSAPAFSSRNPIVASAVSPDTSRACQ